VTLGAAMPIHILLVEDLADCAAITAVLLSQYGYVVRVARNGPEALAACRQERPDAILLDIGLPGMSGYELAKRLRDEFGSATPFLVAVTGYGRSGDRRQSAAAGIDVHLVKPFDMKELDSILSTLTVTNQ
jgi:two-component system, OmpR family, response regulator